MSQQLQLNLLGGVSILLDGKPVKSLSTRAAQALLIYVLHQPRAVSREQLAFLFFGASKPEQATANLRRTLSAVKKELAAFVEISRYDVGVQEGANVFVDSLVFSKKLTVVSKQSGQDDSRQPLQETLNLYGGDFLAHFYLRDASEFEQWQLQEQERLRLLAIDGLQRLVKLQQDQGDFRAALLSAESLLTIEPLLEQAHRDKLLLLARTGQRGSALRHYTTANTIFDEELGVPLSNETTALFDRIQQLQEPVPLRIPARRRAFIGRNDELATLQQLLAHPERRLITLFGSGGMGKTRLAQAVMRQLYAERAGMFLDGFYFVSLVAADSAESAAQQIAQTVGLALSGSEPATAQVVDQLAKRELLLVLDNFEQLVEPAADFVADLLTACPAVKLLITSRERLHLYEEHVVDLSGLPLPQRDDAAAQSDAVQLFVSNAQQHSVTIAADELVQVAAICRLLDGVPLAIELAAGWTRQYALETIATQIAAGLDFLKTPMRNVPARQRSLRAVFLHSWELLSAELQQTLSALAVFPSSFARADACTIVATDNALLDALLDKSLLQQADDDRLEQHPLLRQYALELLEADANHADAQFATHSHFFAKRLQADTKAIRGSRKVEIEARMLQELDNIRQAWRTASKRADGERLQAMCRTLHQFYDGQQYHAEALAAFEQAAQQYELVHGAPEQMSLGVAVPYGNILSRSGWHTYRRGYFERAQALLEQAAALLRRANAHHLLALTLNDLAVVSRLMNQFDYAKQLQAEALTLHLEGGNTYDAVVTMTTQAYLARDEGRYDDAWQLGLETLKLADQEEDWQALANLLKMLASVATRMGRDDEAIKFNEQALDLSIKHNHLGGQIEAHYQLAGIAFRIDEYDTVRRHLEACEAGLEQIDEPIRMVYVQLLWANLAHDLGETERMIQSLKLAADILADRRHATLRFTVLQATSHVALEAQHVRGTVWLRALLTEETLPVVMRKQVEQTLADAMPDEIISFDAALVEARRWLSQHKH